MALGLRRSEMIGVVTALHIYLSLGRAHRSQDIMQEGECVWWI